MTDTIAFGQYMTLHSSDFAQTYKFQNYWINEDAPFQGDTYGFMPFAFSGSVLTKSGDNQPATIAFPNNALSQGWAEIATKESWIADISTVIVNPDDKSTTTLLMHYVAQIISATWNETALELQLASVLDAVGADVPRKKLTKQLVGHLPLSSRVRMG